MGFPRGFNPSIQQWDDMACEATVVAQIAWMSNRLEFPFDTKAFDRALKRPPGRFIPGQYGMQYLLERVPHLTITSLSQEPLELRADPAYVRQYFQNQQVPDRDIDEYLRSADFRAMQGRVGQYMALRRTYPARLRSHVTPNIAAYVTHCLNQGSVVIYPRSNEGELTSHIVAIMRNSHSRPGCVQLYDPARGLTPSMKLARSEFEGPGSEGATIYTPGLHTPLLRD